MLTHTTPADWHADLNYLMDALAREHCNLFHSVSHERLDTAVRSLRRRLAALAAHEIVIEMARLVALVGDGHTCLPLDESPGFRRYPLRIYHYADGLFVQGSAPEHAAIVGARLLTIGDLPAIEAYDAMRPLISRDNEMGVRTAAPVLLTIPEVLHACGVLGDPERASFVVQQPGGKQRTCILRPVETPLPDLIDARDGAAAPPLWLQRPSEQNWCEYLPDAGALYVQYGQVRDGPDERLDMFFDRVFGLIAREAVERLILDIRLNGGGNMSLNRSLIHHLIRCDKVNQWGKLFVIIGRRTFSAAMNLAVDLERHTQVLFVGEPTGGRPNHYGENAAITLPHSSLHATASALWWQYSYPGDDRPWIAPDIPAALWSGDYVANRDPAVEAALGYIPQPAQPGDDRHRPNNRARRYR